MPRNRSEQEIAGYRDVLSTIHSGYAGLSFTPGTVYREFERRVGIVTTSHGAKRGMVFEVVLRLPQRFQYADVERACPGTSRPTINRALRELRQQGLIRCIKAGRDAVWEKT